MGWKKFPFQSFKVMYGYVHIVLDHKPCCLCGKQWWRSAYISRDVFHRWDIDIKTAMSPLAPFLYVCHSGWTRCSVICLVFCLFFHFSLNVSEQEEVNGFLCANADSHMVSSRIPDNSTDHFVLDKNVTETEKSCYFLEMMWIISIKHSCFLSCYKSYV